ncbi:MAG TPA: AAA family ATPase [Caulobacteraceae bacterium]|jgi:chromosome partitioning protein|nr:AAA family ATPase [Caulobacteraceae bacterium]
MRTIAVIARKGGSGKTTVASHLALAAHLRGRRTLIADIDPQRSAMEVLKARRGEGPQGVDVAGPELFGVQVSAVRAGVEAMVVDTAAGAEEELAHAIVLADLCLLVLRPTFLDMAAAIQTVEIVRRLRKPTMIVVNQAPAARGGIEPPQVRKALQALRLMRLPVVPTTLRARAAYQAALETGRSVEELSGDPAAAQEVADLWDFIERFAFARRAEPAFAG